MKREEVHKYLLSFKGAWLDYPFGKDIAVYKVGPKSNSNNSALMFAILNEDKIPLRISLRCDPVLSQVLREKYVEVMAADKLSKKDWNTLVLSGQLSWDEVKGLIRHSYDLTLAGKD